jgi:class 3 adenylate cyclase
MSENRTWMATVLFLDIVGYSKVSVNQELNVKIHFNNLVSKELSHIDANDCIRIDTGDGVAICYLGDPESVYPLACRLRDVFVALESDDEFNYQVRLGLNLGPIKIVEGINGERNCVGVGINDAQRIMSFAAPNQLLISKSYFDMVNSLSDEYSNQLKSAGTHADKHDKQHEVYELAVELVRAPHSSTTDSSTTTEPVENKFDSKAMEHLKSEYAKYVGSSKADEVINSSAASASSLADLCTLLTNELSSDDDRYHFRDFTKYYGFSGY